MSATPVVVVGSGIAGLWTALHAAPLPVVVLTGDTLGAHTATGWAQGGIAAALGGDDDPDRHAQDTIAAGCGLVNEGAARRMVQSGAEEVRALEDIGVAFEHLADGRWALSREAAHSRARVARVRGDQAGAAILEALTAAVRRAGHIEIRERWQARGLVRDANGGCAGVVARGPDGEDVVLSASATVLATGGLGGLYAQTTNPSVNQGRAMAWAASLGALIRDAEFVQFHPTAIDIGRSPAPLATEALRGDGATLVDRRGRRFLPSIHDAAELAPRDVVARAVHRQLRTGQGAFLDIRRVAGTNFPQRFPAVFSACMDAGLDPRRDLIPVAPAAHYHMGGIATDLTGRTGVDGLLAVGEAACTGVHGGNRLASNSLLEALVMGRGAGQALKQIRLVAPTVPDEAQHAAPDLPASELTRLRRAMADHAGVERDGDGLGRLIETIDGMEARFGAADALIAARLVAAAALARTESRGAHFRLDYPAANASAEPSRMTLTGARAVCPAEHLTRGLTG